MTETTFRPVATRPPAAEAIRPHVGSRTPEVALLAHGDSPGRAPRAPRRAMTPGRAARSTALPGGDYPGVRE